MTKKESKPTNYGALYSAIKFHPEYKEWKDANNRKHSNADKCIQNWIWESTKEEKFHKSDLTWDEYNRIVKELYALGGKTPQTRLAGSYKADDPKDRARKALMAAWHYRLKLLHEDKLKKYKDNPNEYVKSCIMQTCGGQYKTINDIPLSELEAKARKIRAENKVMEGAVGDDTR